MSAHPGHCAQLPPSPPARYLLSAARTARSPQPARPAHSSSMAAPRKGRCGGRSCTARHRHLRPRPRTAPRTPQRGASSEPPTPPVPQPRAVRDRGHGSKGGAEPGPGRAGRRLSAGRGGAAGESGRGTRGHSETGTDIRIGDTATGGQRDTRTRGHADTGTARDGEVGG